MIYIPSNTTKRLTFASLSIKKTRGNVSVKRVKGMLSDKEESFLLCSVISNVYESSPCGKRNTTFAFVKSLRKIKKKHAPV